VLHFEKRFVPHPQQLQKGGAAQGTTGPLATGATTAMAR